MARTSKKAEQGQLSEETRCDVCGPVEGRIAHDHVEVPPSDGKGRMEQAEEYVRERGRDPIETDWRTLVEVLDHLANLRREQMGLPTREEFFEGRLDD